MNWVLGIQLINLFPFIPILRFHRNQIKGVITSYQQRKKSKVINLLLVNLIF